MDEIAGSAGTKGPRKRLRVRLQRRSKAWLRSPAAVGLGAGLIHGALRFIRRTQALAAGSSDYRAILTRHHPAIVGLWHGQHLLAPFFRPEELPYVALLSRSADAELNAAVVARFGIGTIRGSGGRVREAVREKGGARALIQLKRSLDRGSGVCMIADVPKGTPREAGLGIVTLARLSGRPIIPSAAVTSRRHVVERSWDRTTLPLPFGRIAVVMGEPITVPPDADPAEMERLRAEITRAIEAANAQALRLADGGRP
ncbi:lysophospholipid acyltransferase family protein [Aureimonas sp. SK2]|uniref:lysophospholipid acyltransferase family protein n=1 Tax=Aureimonas sp. SK2 TaxID=3015992 RepID=UPI0024447C1A|nr:lysophospholipid acyltransferase family protein [Aureimonas sp. SK2]